MHRDREREGRPAANFTLHADPAPVQFDELAAESQPEARSLSLLLRSPHLAELLEHGLLILRRNADAGIADRYLNRSIHRHRPQFDPSALRRGLEPLPHRVQEDQPTLPPTRRQL